MDKHYRLTCSGGDADGWLVSDETLEGDISATLQDWAGDDLGAWGYGDGSTRCANHAVGAFPEDGCEDYADADYAAVWERIDKWASQNGAPHRRGAVRQRARHDQACRPIALVQAAGSVDPHPTPAGLLRG